MVERCYTITTAMGFTWVHGAKTLGSYLNSHIPIINQSAEITIGLGFYIGGSRKLSSLSKHEVFEQLWQTLNGERM